ncbi:MAG: hypothetical protein U5L45_12805 [Saprospiraceae bacterium]|nr:hypothetical protein [Saprospiraceae bacterium]
MGHFSGFARKMTHLPSLARAKRAREVVLEFYVWFQIILIIKSTLLNSLWRGIIRLDVRSAIRGLGLHQSLVCPFVRAIILTVQPLAKGQTWRCEVPPQYWHNPFCNFYHLSLSISVADKLSATEAHVF